MKGGFVMGDYAEFYFEDLLLEILEATQLEAKRRGVRCISDILLLKNLIFSEKTEMNDFINLVGLDFEEVKEIIEKDVKSWVKEAKKKYEYDPEMKDQKELGEFNEENQKYLFEFDENVGIILNKAVSYSSASDGACLDEVAFVLGMFDDPSNYLIAFFKEININTEVVYRYFEGITLEDLSTEVTDAIEEQMEENDENEESAKSSTEQDNSKSNDEDGKFVIPKKLREFVKIVEAEESSVSPILGRDRETEELTKVLLKAKKSNAILVGNPGVGKTAIIEDLAWRIKNGKCAEDLKNRTVISLSVNDIIAGTTLRGMAEERFKNIAEFLEKADNVILFIDEIHNVIGAGDSSGDEQLDFANALKPILAREGVSVIGATTEYEYERILRKDGAFKRRFEKIEIREPSFEEVYPMVKEQVRRLSKYHGIAITKPVVEFIIKVSGCFIFETSNPDRTLDLVDKSMATAKYLKKKVVSKEIVLNNFDANFRLYSKMSEEFKTSTAYHEAGHFLVARYGKRYSKNALAVSIIPADDYLGVTVYDDEPLLIDMDYTAHLEKVARMLGGRVAEKMFTGKETSGARSDLKVATEEARSMIVEYGLSKSFSRRNSEKDFYEERTKELNIEIDKIIDEAYQIAENILKEHEYVLKEIVKALVKQGVLIQDDLEKICQKAESKKARVTKTQDSIIE